MQNQGKNTMEEVHRAIQVILAACKEKEIMGVTLTSACIDMLITTLELEKCPKELIIGVTNSLRRALSELGYEMGDYP
jgi:hypothetical protein